MQAEPLQIGDQVGDHALEDALTLAQDVELRQKEKDEENTMSGSGRSHDTSTDPFPLPITGRSPLHPREPSPSPCQTSQRAWHWAGGWCR